jgi:hypothetical protein
VCLKEIRFVAEFGFTVVRCSTGLSLNWSVANEFETAEFATHSPGLGRHKTFFIIILLVEELKVGK